MKTAAAYIRVSTDEQIEYSPESQLREIKKFALSHELILNSEYIFIDEGISGRKTTKRNAFNQMIAAAKSSPKPFDVILVWKFSRFARNQEESIVYKSLLRKQLDIDIVSTSEPLIEGPFGSLIERIIEWMDEYYSIRLSGEVNRGMTEKALRGEIQSSTPFGYRKSGKHWVIEEKEADIIKYIFESYANSDTLASIAKEVNLMGAKTKHKNPMSHIRIKYILQNVAYTGTLHWNGIENKDKIPRIIDDDLFAKAQARLLISKHEWNKYAKPVNMKRHYLSGILKCADCGQSMTYHSAKEGFQCNGYRANKCFSHFIKDFKINGILIDTLNAILKSSEYIKNVRKMSVTNDFNIIKKEIERNEAMLKKAKTAYLEGIDSIEEYSATKELITSKIQELGLRAKGANGTEQDTIDLYHKISNLITLLKDDKSTLEEKHNSLCGCIRKIEYKKPDEQIVIFFYV